MQMIDVEHSGDEVSERQTRTWDAPTPSDEFQI